MCHEMSAGVCHFNPLTLSLFDNFLPRSERDLLDEQLYLQVCSSSYKNPRFIFHPQMIHNHSCAVACSDAKGLLCQWTYTDDATARLSVPESMYSGLRKHYTPISAYCQAGLKVVGFYLFLLLFICFCLFILLLH